MSNVPLMTTGPSSPGSSPPTDSGPSPSSGPAVDAVVQPLGGAPLSLRFEDLTLPEGVTADSEGLKNFLGIANGGFSRKEQAQGLIDLHKRQMDAYRDSVDAKNREAWGELNAGWERDLRADEQIGGNRLHTSINTAVSVLNEVLTPADRDQLLQHLDSYGMANYVPFIKFLVNVGRKLNVSESGITKINPPAPKPERGLGNRGWYDNSPVADIGK